jgi:hypothetical protein
LHACWLRDLVIYLSAFDSTENIEIYVSAIIPVKPQTEYNRTRRISQEHYGVNDHPGRGRGGLDFTAIGGKRQGREVPQPLRVEPGAKHPVWKTQ